MNPVKFLYGLVKDIEKSDKVTIFEEMPVDDWINGTTWSGLYITIPKNIICTTHFPFYKKAGGYNNKLYQNRSYIMALIMCRSFMECMQMRLITDWHCEDIKI